MGNTFCSVRLLIPQAVHPHGRGEHCAPDNCRDHPYGSSPRAWGTRIVQASMLRDQGGSSPRAWGTHKPVVNCLRVRPGSSPRAWGTHKASGTGLIQQRFIPTGVGNTHLPRDIDQAARFIPTGVGNTGNSAGAASGRTVHPHGRGEHPSCACHFRVCIGSSPRAWGTHLPF